LFVFRLKLHIFLNFGIQNIEQLLIKSLIFLQIELNDMVVDHDTLANGQNALPSYEVKTKVKRVNEALLFDLISQKKCTLGGYLICRQVYFLQPYFLDFLVYLVDLHTILPDASVLYLRLVSYYLSHNLHCFVTQQIVAQIKYLEGLDVKKGIFYDL
jgi:hypothetical protein